jgi:hypothetical protein
MALCGVSLCSLFGVTAKNNAAPSESELPRLPRPRAAIDAAQGEVQDSRKRDNAISRVSADNAASSCMPKLTPDSEQRFTPNNSQNNSPGPRQQGRQVQEAGFPSLGTERSAEWRGRSAAEVCTSEARKIGCLLSRARNGVPQQAWSTFISVKRRDCFGSGSSGGRCGEEQVAQSAMERRHSWTLAELALVSRSREPIGQYRQSDSPFRWNCEGLS